MQMLQHPYLVMMIVKPIKKDVLQLVKDVSKQQQNLYVLHIQEITLLVLDMLDQMEFVKEMLEVLSVELESVKMVHLILMIFANNTNKVVEQMAKIVFHHCQVVTHIKELPHLVLYILVQMVFAKEQVQQLKQLVQQKFVMKLQIQQQLMMLVINIKLIVLLQEKDVLLRLI